MRVIALALSVVLPALLSTSVAAQEVDCAKHVQRAQAAIDRTTEDIKGMDKMPKDQLLSVHVLLDDAEMLLDGARRTCERHADFDRARAIARAEAARGSAEAADILHWHLMRDMPGMKPAAGVPGTSMPGMKR